MAKRLEVEALSSHYGRKSIYPWSDWTDGSVWQIEEGEDYDDVVKIKGALRSHAYGHGMRVTIADPGDEPGTVRFQFTKKAGK